MRDLRALLEMIGQAPRSTLPGIIALAAARLAAEPEPEPLPPKPMPPLPQSRRWLTVAQVAERLGRDARWVYRRCHRWDFVHREGRSLLFDEVGLTRYMERHRLGSL